MSIPLKRRCSTLKTSHIFPAPGVPPQSMDLPVQDVSYKGNHTPCVLLCLLPSLSSVCSGSSHAVGCVRGSLLFHSCGIFHCVDRPHAAYPPVIHPPTHLSIHPSSIHPIMIFVEDSDCFISSIFPLLPLMLLTPQSHSYRCAREHCMLTVFS